MTAELQTGLATTAVTVLAGVLGYLYREVRQRSKPFVEILDFDGRIQERKISVSVPKKAVDRSQTAIIIRHLHEDDTLSGCDQALNETKELADNGEQELRNVDNVIAAIEQAKSHDTIGQSLCQCIEPQLFQRFIILLLAKERVKVEPATKSLPVVLQVHPSKEKSGCVWIGFPGNPTLFGGGFDKEPILRALAMPFVDMVSAMDVDRLLVFFRSVRGFLREEVSIAKEVLPTLKQAVEEHCRWGTEVFLANITRSPLLIMPSGSLSIKDETGAEFLEDCYLVRLTPEEDGTRTRNDAKAPLIVRSGADERFEFMTRNTQVDMKRGKALRDAFESGKAKARIQFTMTQPGLIPKRRIVTPWVRFGG